MALHETKHKEKKQLYFGILILILLLGTGLRIAKSDMLPLDSVEAVLALDAKDMLAGNVEIAEPFYTGATSFFFWIFEENNFFARLLPIFAGSALILLPWSVGDLFSDRVKLLLSLGLAIDPALMAASKTAGSYIIAVVALWLMILFFVKKKPLGFGVMLSIFFMSGANFIIGGVITALTLLWLILRDPDSEFIKANLRNYSWRSALIASVVSYVLISSAFFTNPAGVGGGFRDLASVFQANTLQSISIGMGALVIAFIAYEIVPFLLSLVGMITERRERTLLERACMWMSLIAFLVILLNPSRLALNLIWVSTPLWVIAAQQLDIVVEGFKEFNPISLAVGMFFLLMIGFLLFTYVGAVNIEYDNQKLLLRSLLLGGGVLLVAISYILTVYTWEGNVAKNALMLGLGFYLVVFGFFGQSWHSAFLGVGPQNEIWRQSMYLVDAERMIETIGDISEMNHGQRIQQEVVILDMQSPAMEWLLRDHDVVATNAITVDEVPEMIITGMLEPQMWGAEYTGQDFRISSTPNWSWLNIREWLHWTIFHEVEEATEEMAILWVRTDLFPGTSASE